LGPRFGQTWFQFGGGGGQRHAQRGPVPQLFCRAREGAGGARPAGRAGRANRVDQSFGSRASKSECKQQLEASGSALCRRPAGPLHNLQLAAGRQNKGDSPAGALIPAGPFALPPAGWAPKQVAADWARKGGGGGGQFDEGPTFDSSARLAGA